MKNSILLLILNVLMVLSVAGQGNSSSTNVTLGVEKKTPKRTKIVNIIGSDETGFYVLKNNIGFNGFGVAEFIERYDIDMNLVVTEKIESEYEGNQLFVKLVIPVEKEIYFISVFKNRKTNKGYLFSQSINKSTLKVNDDINQIGEINLKEIKYLESKNFLFKFSEDCSKLLIYYDLAYDKGDAKKIGVHVLDSNFNQLWTKEITLPYEEAFFTFKNLIVDNNGLVHMTGNLHDKNWDEREKFMPKRKFLILSYEGQEALSDETQIELKDSYIEASEINFNTDLNSFYCGGFYSLDGDIGDKGYFFLKINRDTKEIISKSKKRINPDIIARELTDKEEGKVRKGKDVAEDIGKYRFEAERIVIHEDGSALLIGNRYYTERYVINNGGVISKGTYVYFRDIIVCKVNSEGDIIWTELIPKGQTRGIEGSTTINTYHFIKLNDKSYFTFNDNPSDPSNVNHGFPEPEKDDFKPFVVFVTLNNDGSYSKKPIFHSFDAEYMAIAQMPAGIFSLVCKQISDNELIFLGKKKKTYRFVKVDYN